MKKVVWIDFENAPHVWVFKEFINEFKSRDIDLILTARNFSSTLKLCNYFKLEVEQISGEKTHKGKFGKVFDIFSRAKSLITYFEKNEFNKEIYSGII